MERKKYAQRKNKLKKRNSPPETLKNKKITELITKYRMSEASALEVAYGILPLETWKQRKKTPMIPSEENPADKTSSPYQPTIFSPQTAVEILKILYDSADYSRQKNIKTACEKKIHNLAQKENIPVSVASDIINQHYSLKDYLAQEKKKKERSIKALDIHKKYPDIALGTCFQIIDEGISINKYLQRREARRQRREEWYHNYLQRNQSDNETLGFYLQKLHNKKIPTLFTFFNLNSVIGMIVKYTPYSIKVEVNGKYHSYPKLYMKYICQVNYAKHILSRITIDYDMQSKNFKPDSNPRKRYQIPNEILQEGKRIQVTLGGGEIFTGTISWFSRYDLKLLISMRPKASVIIFRHAVVLAREL